MASTWQYVVRVLEQSQNGFKDGSQGMVEDTIEKSKKVFALQINLLQ